MIKGERCARKHCGMALSFYVVDGKLIVECRGCERNKKRLCRDCDTRIHHNAMRCKVCAPRHTKTKQNKYQARLRQIYREHFPPKRKSSRSPVDTMYATIASKAYRATPKGRDTTRKHNNKCSQARSAKLRKIGAVNKRVQREVSAE